MASCIFGQACPRGTAAALNCEMALDMEREYISNTTDFICKHCGEEFNLLEHFTTACAWSLTRTYRVGGKLLHDEFEGDASTLGECQQVPLTFKDQHGVVSLKFFFRYPRRMKVPVDAVEPSQQEVAARDFRRYPKSEFRKALKTLKMQPADTDPHRRRHAPAKDFNQLGSSASSTTSTMVSDGANFIGDQVGAVAAKTASGQVGTMEVKQVVDRTVTHTTTIWAPWPLRI